VAALLRAIDGYRGSNVTRYALQLAPLVFVRPGELRKAEWNEIDLEAGEWRIPAGRMKMKTNNPLLVSRFLRQTVMPSRRKSSAAFVNSLTHRSYMRCAPRRLNAAALPISREDSAGSVRGRACGGLEHSARNRDNSPPRQSKPGSPKTKLFRTPVAQPLRLFLDSSVLLAACGSEGRVSSRRLQGEIDRHRG
jgi:hypothetical protein